MSKTEEYEPMQFPFYIHPVSLGRDLFEKTKSKIHKIYLSEYNSKQYYYCDLVPIKEIYYQLDYTLNDIDEQVKKIFLLENVTIEYYEQSEYDTVNKNFTLSYLIDNYYNGLCIKIKNNSDTCSKIEEHDEDHYGAVTFYVNASTFTNTNLFEKAKFGFEKLCNNRSYQNNEYFILSKLLYWGYSTFNDIDEQIKDFFSLDHVNIQYFKFNSEIRKDSKVGELCSPGYGTHVDIKITEVLSN